MTSDLGTGKAAGQHDNVTKNGIHGEVILHNGTTKSQSPEEARKETRKKTSTAEAEWKSRELEVSKHGPTSKLARGTTDQGTKAKETTPIPKDGEAGTKETGRKRGRPR